MSSRTSKILKRFYAEDSLEAGVDEAGRGPLFARVYAGVAILPPEDFDHSLMRDSKKLSARKRLIAYDYIKENAIDCATHYVEAHDIDKINIFNATHSAMHGAIDKLLVRPDIILVDGGHFRTYTFENRKVDHVCIEGGDDAYTPIAAGSILAKVERDKYILDLCDRHENLNEFYGLTSNKGYGTSKHIEGIKLHGITPWHRKTFGICRQYVSAS